jgi:multiple sugar transport system permease protein
MSTLPLPPETSSVGDGGAHTRRLIGRVLQYTLLTVAAAVMVVPFYWMVISSLKTNAEIFAQPIQWWPNPIRWENYRTAWSYPGFDFLRLLWNSLYYSGLVTIGTVISSALVGYGLALFRFPGRSALFSITIATLIIPPVVTFIPVYVMFQKMGLLGTYAPLILPAFVGNAFWIFMMRQFFLGLPRDLLDAGRIDGANEFRIFWQIMLPLVQPALIVVAVFTLLATWNDFFGPLIYLSDPYKYPLSLGLYSFRAQRSTEWALLMAASVLVTLPVIALFAFGQRYFMTGIKTTGLVR